MALQSRLQRLERLIDDGGATMEKQVCAYLQACVQRSQPETLQSLHHPIKHNIIDMHSHLERRGLA